ncbi:aprataxin [Diabrotica virgifera virgifera]|uniref:HIT domain-containing protein n=1 Tax=Diabrotica virgifera virgifera TaxID=50390 RepID=A0ABM5L8G3_DIAVI|nr:aprataxin [Diabrotica virgifera virgifera]XP_050518724.1 aprataxin [Diabrotica virgifera virgifera]
MAKSTKTSWQQGLVKRMNDPDAVVTSDDLVTVINDLFPKAEVHWLVLPKENISSLTGLKKDHIDLLRHMKRAAQTAIKEEGHTDKKFKMGFHAEPSMSRLHMHVISDDFNSMCLKHKKHWNSFTTDFFLKPEDVIESLETHGKVCILTPAQCKTLIAAPLKCHKCDYKPKNMPDLKKHILSHI